MYKRQVYGTIELAAEAKDEVSDDNSKPGTDDPVSYTHLDVYKRHVHYHFL